MSDFCERAFTEDGGHWFANHYECDCGETWTDHWSCCCDDECPSCGADISPYDSDDLSDEMRAEQGWEDNDV